MNWSIHLKKVLTQVTSDGNFKYHPSCKKEEAGSQICTSNCGQGLFLMPQVGGIWDMAPSELEKT